MMPHTQIRVMHVTGTRAVGGMERWLQCFIPQCDNAQFTSCIVCLNSQSGVTDEWKRAGIRVDCLNIDSPLAIRAVLQLIRKIRQWRPDVLVAHGLRVNLMSRLAARWARVPAVITVQHGTEEWRRWYHSALDRWTSPWVTLYVGVSKACCRALAFRERIPPHKLKTIYIGLDFQPDEGIAERVRRIRLQHPTPRNAVVIGTVARLHPIKGQQHLIRAIPTVMKQCPQVHFILVGQDLSNGRMQALAAQCGVAANVDFVGYDRDVSAWLASFDLFVLPSLSEGLPVALLEAMSMKCPVVATDAGGSAEVVDHGRTGLIVPPGNEARLAEAIIELACDRERRLQLGEMGYLRVRKHFSAEAMVESWRETLTACVEKKKGRRQNPAG